MALNKLQMMLRADRELVTHANTLAAWAAADHGVLVAEVVNFKQHHSKPVVAARTQLVLALTESVQYRDAHEGYRIIGRTWLVGTMTPDLASEGWRPISTPDMAVLVGARDHSAIVLTLQRARKLRRARRMAQEVAA